MNIEIGKLHFHLGLDSSDRYYLTVIDSNNQEMQRTYDAFDCISSLTVESREKWRIATHKAIYLIKQCSRDDFYLSGGSRDVVSTYKGVFNKERND